MYNKPNIITSSDKVWNASTGQTVQDNHYYPYGAMFGESAAVEYVNAVAGINNIASTNAEVSTNPYRYGGKEWLMQEGLNYYDFAARQYDPATGRFIHPDPLNGKYPHLSSYLYCAGNPINATDPSGLAVIYDMNGNYLGQSVEGFTGEILIYKGQYIQFDDGTIYNFKIGDKYTFSDFTGAFLSEYLTSYESADLSPSAQVSIWNNIIGHFEGMKIFDETFSISRITDDEIKYIDKIENPSTSWGTVFMYTDGSLLDKPKISGTGNFIKSYEATVENIGSSVLVHEWYSHGIKHYDDISKNHQLAYMNVIGFDNLWHKTTDKYKSFNIKMLTEYILSETISNILKGYKIHLPTITIHKFYIK